MLGGNLCAPRGAATAFPLGEGGAVRTFENSAACGGAACTAPTAAQLP